jgi:hypothetical protein
MLRFHQKWAESPLVYSPTCKNQQTNNPKRCPKLLWTNLRDKSKLIEKMLSKKQQVELATYNTTIWTFSNDFIGCLGQQRKRHLDCQIMR